MRVPLTALATGVLVLSACADEDGVGNPSLVRDTLPGGVPVFRYGVLPSASEAREAPADLRIGTRDGDGPTAFGDIRAVDAASDGTIFVLDHQAGEVRAFDASGMYQATVVQKGPGPGEVVEANGMRLVGDSLLWLQDHGRWANIAVTRDGTEVARVPMHVRNYAYVWNGTVDDHGRFWKRSSHSDAPTPYPPEPGLQESSFRQYLHWFDPATNQGDSVLVGEARARAHISRTDRGGYAYMQIPFDAVALSVVAPDGGFWHTDDSDYSIASRDMAGDTLLVIEAGTEPVSVTPADREEVTGRIAGGDDSHRRQAEAVADLMSERKPPVLDLIADDRGRLWVRRSVAHGAQPLFDVFTGEGIYTGTIRLGFEPAPGHRIAVRDDRIYAVVRDELDVPFVVRAAVPPLGGGAAAR